MAAYGDISPTKNDLDASCCPSVFSRSLARTLQTLVAVEIRRLHALSPEPGPDIGDGYGSVRVATGAGREALAVWTRTPERLTGIWPRIGISPNSARAALISETVTFEKAQM